MQSPLPLLPYEKPAAGSTGLGTAPLPPALQLNTLAGDDARTEEEVEECMLVDIPLLEATECAMDKALKLPPGQSSI